MFLEKQNSFLKTNWRKVKSKKVEWVTLDSYYFTEYGIEHGYIIKNAFHKINKWDKLIKDLEESTISIRGKWLVAVACTLWYVLDKVYNIFISRRDEADYYTFTTIDGFSLEVTEEMEVLTEDGYKPAFLVKNTDRVMTMVGSTFGFKNTGGNKVGYIDINAALAGIKEKFWQSKHLYMSDLSETERRLVYMLWFKLAKDRKLLYSEFVIAQKYFWEKKNKKAKKTDGEDEEIDYNSRRQFQLNNIISGDNKYQFKELANIKKERKKNIMVFNINTTVAENIIFNNFIVRQNC